MNSVGIRKTCHQHLLKKNASFSDFFQIFKINNNKQTGISTVKVHKALKNYLTFIRSS